MYSNTETKTCCKCNITKPKNKYYTNPARKDNCSSEFYSIQNNCSKKAINSNISSCCRLKRNNCQGFGWKYLHP